ncbi:MAG: type II toxin-antitoxin system HicB family antitoxin [Dehalococcoidia bacterium]|nr:type II toxin-antitoxin system HicB family antitoxin [Dehalococcoidia bacterium]
MLTEYLRAAMKRAKYEMLPDNNTYYGSIPQFDGVYANSDNLENCRNELEDVLEEWLLFRISRRLSLPIVDGIDLRIREFV